MRHHGCMPGDDLTDEERRFLIEYVGLTAAELTPEALAETSASVERAVAAALEEVRSNALTLSEVATLVGQPPSSVMQSATMGDVYSVSGERPTDQVLFPRWQFHEGRAIPHLREVMEALPDGYHPLLVQNFMTSWSEDYLDGWPPATWLLTGRDPAAVVQYADELSWI